MGIACLTNYFNKVIDTYGTDITLRVVTVTSTNERGDPTLSNSDTTVKARVETSNGAKIKEMVGDLKLGDIVVFFKGSQTGIVKGNKIIYKNVVYKIYDVRPRETADGLHFYMTKAELAN